MEHGTIWCTVLDRILTGLFYAELVRNLDTNIRYFNGWNNNRREPKPSDTPVWKGWPEDGWTQEGWRDTDGENMQRLTHYPSMISRPSGIEFDVSSFVQSQFSTQSEISTGQSSANSHSS